MFSDRLALQIADAAKIANISESGLLAIVEVETSGSPLEADGRTPTFLFERHIFRRELAARRPEKVKVAEKAGLAIPKWDRATQYRDERTSADRLDLLGRATEIDEDCALRSCSWGLPQIMGNECVEVGFPTARDMIDFMKANGVGGHLAIMVRFLKSRKLESAIDRKDWAYVALRYNGAGYAKNQYDTRLAAADKKWERKLPQLRAAGSPADYPEQHLTRDEIEQIQIKLRQLDYTEVGNPDGRWGDKTAAAVFAFQKHEGLSATGHLDDETRAALDDASPRPVPEARANTTLDDLREAGSSTIAKADATDLAGKVKIGTGTVIAGGSVLESTLGGAQDKIDKANDAIDKVHQVHSIWTSAHDLIQPLLSSWPVLLIGAVLIVGGFVVIRYAKSIKASRLEDHQTGVHAGTMRD